jgi:hypothetical protein
VARDCQGFDLQGPDWEHTIYTHEFIQIEVSKRVANLVYYLPNKSVVAIDNVSEHVETQSIDPVMYLRFFSTIFRTWSETAPDPSQMTLEQLLLEVSQTGCQFQANLPSWQWHIPYLNLLALPFITQQHSIERMPDLTSLPSENNITISYVMQRTNISLDPRSFWVFCILSMLSIASCGVLIIKNFLGDGPQLSGFHEIDFIIKQVFLKEKLGKSRDKVELFRKLAETRIRIPIEGPAFELESVDSAT